MVRRKTWSDVEVSAYLDGELDAATREAFETALAEDQALRRRVDSLRDVVGLVHAAPLREPPRNYLLTPGMVVEKTPQPTGRRRAPFLLRLATSAVAAAFVVTTGLGIANRGISPAMVTQRDVADTVVVTMHASEAVVEEPEMALLSVPEQAEEPPLPEDLAAFGAQPDQDAAGATRGGLGGGGDEGVEKAVVEEAPAATERADDLMKEAPGDGVLEGGPPLAISQATGETGKLTPTPAPAPEPIAAQVAEEHNAEVPRMFPPPWLPVTLGVATLILTGVTIGLSRKR